jgi:CRP-like cAMP-binding protein
VYDQLKKQINGIIDLTTEEFDHFLTVVQHREFKRKEMLLNEGEICHHAYFINKGCLRYFYNVDGEQHTGQFFFERNWYCDYESFLSGKPSRQNIEALEKTKVLMVHKAALEKLYITIPKFERFGRIMAEKAFMGLRCRTEMLANQNPEERYLRLIKQRPKLIERIPQHYIASYLAIKPQSLSRIRKRILENA